MANWEGYRAITDEANRVGWPEHFREDLTRHDRAVLSRKDAPHEFGWVLRRHGTHLLIRGTWWNFLWAVAVVRNEARSGGPYRYYWFDGEQLHRVTAEEMIRKLTPPLLEGKRGRYIIEHVDLSRDEVVIRVEGGAGLLHHWPLKGDVFDRLTPVWS